MSIHLSNYYFQVNFKDRRYSAWKLSSPYSTKGVPHNRLMQLLKPQFPFKSESTEKAHK